MTDAPATRQHHRNDEDLVTATATTSPPDDDLLPLPDIIRLAGIGKTMIYRLERKGDFPKRYKPGGYASRWSRREVMEWREAQRQARRP